MPVDPGTATVVSGLIGGLTSAFGQSSANRRNIQLAREQMQFQREMSNTAVFRRMQDLRRSGINPLLAGRYDASSPAGALATMQNVGGAAVEGATKGAAVMTARETARNLKATRQETQARTALLDTQRRALGTAAEIGDLAVAGITWMKNRLGDVDYKSLGEMFMKDYKKLRDALYDSLAEFGSSGKGAMREVEQALDSIRWYIFDRNKNRPTLDMRPIPETN